MSSPGCNPCNMRNSTLLSPCALKELSLYDLSLLHTFSPYPSCYFCSFPLFFNTPPLLWFTSLLGFTVNTAVCFCFPPLHHQRPTWPHAPLFLLVSDDLAVLELLTAFIHNGSLTEVLNPKQKSGNC